MKNSLITHLVCGYPNLEESEKILKILSKYSKFVEIQFPFSDPIADGPVISKANEIALEKGMTTKKSFEFVEKNITLLPTPLLEEKWNKTEILIMTYYNIVFNYGVEKFVKKAKEIGVYGLIIPDIPFDEEDGKKLNKICRQYEINLIQIVSPNVSKFRLKKIGEIATGFVYAVSQNMTTGNKGKFGKDFEEYVSYLKKNINIRIGVGFGIKNKTDVEKVCNQADFAIIGSEMIRKYNDGGIKELKKYLEGLIVK